MRIGIDIDNTITHTRESIIDYAVKFNGASNIDADVIPKGYTMEECFGWDEELTHCFFDTYLTTIYENVLPKADAIDVINYLNQDNSIFLITARNKFYPRIEEITLNWLRKQGLQYDELIMNSTDNMHHCSKLGLCMQYELDLMIEDHHDISLEICRHIPVLMFDYPYNAHINDKNITRVSNWLEVRDIIDKISQTRTA